MDISPYNDDNRIFEKFVNETTSNLNLTEIIEDESHQATTVVIFVISAVLVIILIFVMAVFIDCRQQKIEHSKIRRLKKTVKRKIQKKFPTLPTIGETSHKDDERTIVENMEAEPTSSSSTSSPIYVV